MKRDSRRSVALPWLVLVPPAASFSATPQHVAIVDDIDEVIVARALLFVDKAGQSAAAARLPTLLESKSSLASSALASPP